MKLLVVLLTVLAGVWLWKRGRQRQVPPRARPAPAPTLPMVRCTRCGTHVPGDEAIAGQRGTYCSTAHRRESEGA
ncbi:PP0621 family protein [Ottowia oryzae]|uniref:Uncharacterized protein n=1 Tax=Ottowia oryzae TaxID=2109914 RepID=A0A2S0MIN1_9BURK|nr:PP0621 family protein [Ottowia oryzae]AVO35739.1 hypothetical protein C6570_17060 [Ottowia oryzae]